jgi:hypothetical protein
MYKRPINLFTIPNPVSSHTTSRDSMQARAHQGNWQPQRNRNFRELLSAWVEHMEQAHIEETAKEFSKTAVALRLPVSLVCPRPKCPAVRRCIAYAADKTLSKAKKQTERSMRVDCVGWNHGTPWTAGRAVLATPAVHMPPSSKSGRRCIPMSSPKCLATDFRRHHL